jgi:hypothetical protein
MYARFVNPGPALLRDEVERPINSLALDLINTLQTSVRPPAALQKKKGSGPLLAFNGVLKIDA